MCRAMVSLMRWWTLERWSIAHFGSCGPAISNAGPTPRIELPDDHTMPVCGLCLRKLAPRPPRPRSLATPYRRPWLIWIYALVDPRTSRCCYVGRSRNPGARLTHHMARPTGSIEAWIGALKAERLRPTMRLLWLVDAGDDALVAEATWHRHLLAAGEPLLNGDPTCAGMSNPKRIAAGLRARTPRGRRLGGPM